MTVARAIATAIHQLQCACMLRCRLIACVRACVDCGRTCNCNAALAMARMLSRRSRPQLQSTGDSSLTVCAPALMAIARAIAMHHRFINCNVRACFDGDSALALCAQDVMASTHALVMHQQCINCNVRACFDADRASNCAMHQRPIN